MNKLLTVLLQCILIIVLPDFFKFTFLIENIGFGKKPEYILFLSPNRRMCIGFIENVFVNKVEL